MTDERAYRRLLRAYPAQWRAQHEQEALAVLLDTAEAEGRRRPSAGDVLDVVGHGLLARVGGRLDSGAREATALLAMASLAAVLLWCLLAGEWWPWPVERIVPEDRPLSAWPGTPGPFNTVGAPVMAVMLLGPVLALLGRARAARLVVLAALPAVLLLPVAAAVLDLRRPGAWALAALAGFAGLSVVAPVRQRALLAALSVPLAVLLALPLAVSHAVGQDPRGTFYVGYHLSLVALWGPWLVALVIALAVGRRPLLQAAALVGACWLAVLAVHVWPTDHLYVAPALAVALVLAVGALTWPPPREPVVVRA